MVRVHAFAAIRPRPDRAPAVASPPYDVVDTDEARQLADGNPDSFLHVIRPEIDLPPDTDPYDDAVYARARANLDRMLDQGVLQQEDQPAMYLYRQIMDGHAQTGLVACCHIDDYNNDLIKKHEFTRKDKEDDRTRHVLTLNANTGPVFLTFREQDTVRALMREDMQREPGIDFTSPDNVQHTVWAVRDPKRYVEAFNTIPAAYVADGHHRSASAARAGAERRAANPNHTGDEEYNWFLSVLFPANDLQILAYNRVVQDLNGLSPEQFLEKLREVGSVSPTDNPVPERSGVFCLYVDGGWHRLELDPGSIDRDDPVKSLDVSLLQDRVLGPLLSIGDPRTDKRIDFVGGIRGTGALEKRVESGRAAVAVSMYPTTIEQLLAVADAGQVMPPKSTWFEPKLRSGLFVHALD